MSSYPNLPDVLVNRLQAKRLPIALVGASADQEKYGFRILENLTAKGYNVIPVNPKELSILGLKVVHSVSELPKGVGLVDFVVPPKVTLSVLPLVHAAGIDAVWFQEGSYDSAVLEYARAHFEFVVSGACIMVVTNLL